MEHQDYFFERFTEAKIPDLVSLFAATDNHKYNDVYFRKKFNTSFTGLSYVGYMAYHKGTKEVAAFYGVFPVYLNQQNNRILAAQSGDTITHPKHQKKGLFIALAKQTYQLCKELHIQLVFGFPNGNSAYGFFNKLDWKPDGQIHKYIVPTGNTLLKKLCRKLIPDWMYLSKFKSFAKMSKTNDHRSKGITILRDKDYFSYKEYSPKYVYEYKGITVSFKLDYDLHIGNFYSDTAISREALLKVIQKLSSLTFTSQALLFFSEYDSEMTGLLADYKIENESFENGRLNLVDGFENEHLIFSFEDFDSF